MEKVVLKAEKRSVTGKRVGALRRAGKLPAVLYGHHFESTPIILDRREATKILHELSKSSLVNIELEGSEHAALVREKQRDFIRGTLLHVDFQVVSLTEKIRTKVNIQMTGLAPAIKEFNGIVITGLTELEVESLPQDLPESIVVDVSNLKTIGSGIYVRDIKLSDKVSILDDADEIVVIITSGTTEEEAAEVVPAVPEPEVIEKGKKEEEEKE
jgi:large subunit ribosomal protein L25